MALNYDPKAILAEVKKRVSQNDASRSLKKAMKKAVISALVFAVVSAGVVQLGRYGITVTPEQKSELIKVLIEAIMGGGIVTLAAFFGLDVTKARQTPPATEEKKEEPQA